MIQEMKDKVHVGITATRLVVLGAGLGVVAVHGALSALALNVPQVAFNFAVWDAIAGRFIQAEAALAERDVQFNFPGKSILHAMAGGYTKLVAEAKPKLERLKAVADGDVEVRGGKAARTTG